MGNGNASTAAAELLQANSRAHVPVQKCVEGPSFECFLPAIECIAIDDVFDWDALCWSRRLQGRECRSGTQASRPMARALFRLPLQARAASIAPAGHPPSRTCSMACFAATQLVLAEPPRTQMLRPRRLSATSQRPFL